MFGENVIKQYYKHENEAGSKGAITELKYLYDSRVSSLSHLDVSDLWMIQTLLLLSIALFNGLHATAFWTSFARVNLLFYNLGVNYCLFWSTIPI